MRMITVGTIVRLELRIQVLTSKTFVQSWLIMTWSVTLAGQTGAGANPSLPKKVNHRKDL